MVDQGAVFEMRGRVVVAQAVAEAAQFDGQFTCWCCGQRYARERIVHLGDHPEVGVCLGCAHFLHQQSLRLEDEMRSTPMARVRDMLRAARQLVMRHGWHQKPVIGGLLRWLGRRLP
jgi:hypothetical protein